ncbi:MAG: DNA polymerase III subunit gamma/tau [Clostridia bacterium]|nr:DNA polymerase III subunit gamma/tau [Clostridia bacterium]
MSDYRALYRKWRPRDFDDVCGQDGITDILKYEVANNRLSHAYLFCGSRGTGKTSCAKILAKAVNCENPKDGNPCNCCEACRSIDAGIATDVIEMDAASNNGINDVRDMQDEIAFTPALLKYRVYIIDEVHMMSGQAFNALLKTLEEPPTYVIFILATTENHKLPTTIVSRCQRFDFKRIATDVIISRLLRISEDEGIEITEDAARIIARVSRGGMRDAISLLELCAGANTRIDETLVFDTVGSGNRESSFRMIRAICNSDYETIYSIINDIVMKSGDLSVFWQEIIDAYRDVMIVKNSERAKVYLDLTDSEYALLSDIASEFTMARLSYHTSMLEGAMADMQRAVNSKRSIAEITLTRMCDTRLSSSNEALLLRLEELEKAVKMLKLGVPPVQQQIEPDQDKPKKSEFKTEQKREEPKKVVSDDEKPFALYGHWGIVLKKIAELKRSLSAGFAGASVYTNGKSFVIKMTPFFAEKLNSNETDLAIVRGVIAEQEGTTPDRITLLVESNAKPTGSGSDNIEDLFK